MKRVLLLLALMVAALVLAGYAAACLANGHGGATDCQLPVPPDVSQHCFVGKQRPTPHIGSAYTLDVSAVIQPAFFPILYNCPPNTTAIGAWVMSSSNTDNGNLVQVGYWLDCSWNPTTYYFQTVHDAAGWHFTLLWGMDGGAHTFTIHRTAGTNTFQSSIDGVNYFAPVTVPNAYGRQEVEVEDTVASRTSTCNKARFYFAVYATGPPGYAFQGWHQDPTVSIDQFPGMRYIDTYPGTGTTDYWHGLDWSS